MPGRAGRNSNKNPHYYWNNIAKAKPKAQALASRLGLEFPTTLQSFQAGLVYPIRRLIVTGEDNPDNITTLLGPLWEPVRSKLIKETRIDVLLCPPPGSPNHAVSEHLDAGSPRWTPRPPNAEEEAGLGKVKDMKSKVAKQLGDRKDLNKTDLRELILSMGDNSVEGLPALQAATNSTNQGVKM